MRQPALAGAPEPDEQDEAAVPVDAAGCGVPNWYASIMGTGIVAVAGADLPFRVAGLHMFATVVWALAAAALLALTTACAVRWIRYPDRARADASNPVMAQFWGAPAMALMRSAPGR